MEFEAHNKGISCLVMLSEGTLLSGGERDRKIAAWDSLQNYKRITEIKVLLIMINESKSNLLKDFLVL
jgi:echinoderm microtubule-associated protein-like 1/2